MYPEEIYRFLAERNYVLNAEELEMIISITSNPQLNHISYNNYTNTYNMWDSYGNFYEFTCYEYDNNKDNIKRR